MKKGFLLLLTFNYCFGQLPNTDLWLFTLKKEQSNYLISKGENITNRDGYDNQPSFSADGKKIFYVSIREDKQADVYVYDIGTKKSLPLTKTTESEYSPTYITANKSINCVVVEKDSAQRIWLYDDKSGRQKKMLFGEDSVGYFTFLNSDTVLYYKLTIPHSLRAHSLSTGNDIFIANHIGRGFKPVNRHEFIFGVKDSVKMFFYFYNTLLRKAIKYCEFNSLNEDILWHKEFGLLKSEQAVILKYDDKQLKWIPLFDFSIQGIKKITRFAFDDKTKKIVIVDNK